MGYADPFFLRVKSIPLYEKEAYSMFESLRYRIGTQLLKKAHGLIVSDNFKDMIKGAKYLKMAITIVPPSDELRAFGTLLSQLIPVAQEKRES